MVRILKKEELNSSPAVTKHQTVTNIDRDIYQPEYTKLRHQTPGELC